MIDPTSDLAILVKSSKIATESVARRYTFFIISIEIKINYYYNKVPTGANSFLVREFDV